MEVATSGNRQLFLHVLIKADVCAVIVSLVFVNCERNFKVRGSSGLC